MQAKLVIVEPHTQPNEYLVTLPTTIGRGSEATLKLVHALISRQHCQLFVEQGRIMVRDLGSLNGTFVGGQRVQTAPLMPGELLTIGSVTLRVMYGETMGAAWAMHNKSKSSGPVDTVSLDDTAQASNQSDEEDDLEELLDDSDNDPHNFFRNMN
jgi:pSer/pThr/pTyr-binding forkhead associated (FHA) protein